MKISQLLAETRVIADCRETEKNMLLQRIAEIFARDLPGAASGVILERLLERERVASTGIGHSVAIPHARLSLSEPGGKWLSTPMAAFFRIEAGLEYGAMDNRPVHLVLALISAMENREDHLRALSACSRLLRSPATRAQLLITADRPGLFRLATST